MNQKQQIEARLERSLASQLRAPRLDGRFDAGVWARIEAEQQASMRVAAKPNSAAAWLRASNTAGMIVAGILVVYFGLRLLSGVEVEVPTPQVAVRLVEVSERFFGWGITIAALAFGLMLTPMGRRLRSMLA